MKKVFVYIIICVSLLWCSSAYADYPVSPENVQNLSDLNTKINVFLKDFTKICSSVSEEKAGYYIDLVARIEILENITNSLYYMFLIEMQHVKKNEASPESLRLINDYISSRLSEFALVRDLLNSLLGIYSNDAAFVSQCEKTIRCLKAVETLLSDISVEIKEELNKLKNSS